MHGNRCLCVCTALNREVVKPSVNFDCLYAGFFTLNSIQSLQSSLCVFFLFVCYHFSCWFFFSLLHVVADAIFHRHHLFHFPEMPFYHFSISKSYTHMTHTEERRKTESETGAEKGTERKRDRRGEGGRQRERGKRGGAGAGEREKELGGERERERRRRVGGQRNRELHRHYSIFSHFSCKLFCCHFMHTAHPITSHHNCINVYVSTDTHKRISLKVCEMSELFIFECECNRCVFADSIVCSLNKHAHSLSTDTWGAPRVWASSVTRTTSALISSSCRRISSNYF